MTELVGKLASILESKLQSIAFAFQTQRSLRSELQRGFCISGKLLLSWSICSELTSDLQLYW
jgi:hypothetical protein